MMVKGNESELVTTTEMAPVGTTPATMPRFGTDEFDTDLTDLDWPAETTKTSLRLAKPTAILIGLLLLAGGFWGGIMLQKNEGSSSSSGFPNLSAVRSALSGASGTTGASSPFGSSSNSTIGTVTDINGNTLYVTDSSGSLVKVTLSSSTSVSRNAKASLSVLKPGDSVIVSGVKTSKGQMTASSISATQAGVSSGLPSGGFGGGGARSTGSGSSSGG
jgi:hypothetical protein